MRLLTFNAASGKLENRVSLLERVPFDVACMQEVQRPVAQNDQLIWVGTNPLKGVSIEATGDYRLRALPVHEDVQDFFVPVEVTGPNSFLLFAVWSQKGPLKYVRAISAALASYADEIRGRDTVVLGDFNSNSRWNDEHPDTQNHGAVVQTLATLGCVSAYHEFFREEHGSESTPTHFFQHNKDKPFHLDYVFIPAAWKSRLSHVSVGTFDDGTGISDHRPVLVTID